jgi:hypothetical protein
MKTIALVLAVLVLAASVAMAAVPRTVSYQGVLRDAVGNTVPDGNYQLTFRLYSAASGGSALWTEIQTVAVSGGILNATLGSLTALNLAFDVQYWLGISVASGAELTPRVQLTAAPYALRAAVADAVPSGGLTLPYVGSVSSAQPAFKITNTASSNYAELGRSDRGVYGSAAYAGGNVGVYGICGDGISTGGSGYLGGTLYGAYGTNALSGNYGYLGGASNGVYGYSASGTAGYFGGNVYTSGRTITSTFRVMDGAAAGKVLTSDASGNATWQTISGATDSDWTISGSDMYSAVSGNVGIGLTNANRKLYVAQGVTGLAYPFKLENTDVTIGTSAAGVLFSVGGSGVERGKGALVYRCEDTWNRGSFHFLQESSLSTANPTMSNSVMTIMNGGNVGIGTTSPAAKLDVNGTVRMSALKLSTAGYEGDFLKLGASGEGTWQRFLPLDVSGNSTDALLKVTNYTSGGQAIFGNGRDCGVIGQNNYSPGVIGKLGTVGDGVQGYTTIAGDWAGVYGEANTSGKYGVLGVGWFGVRGVGGLDDGIGVDGYGKWGVRGTASLDANALAGYFEGDIDVVGSISKQYCYFVIDHPQDPENRILRHSTVESPEMLLLYRGKITLDSTGEAVVEMPSYYTALAGEEDATVNLTPVGRSQSPGKYETSYEWEPSLDRFRVYGEPGREIAWLVMAGRDDAAARQRPMVVEEEKGPAVNCEKGTLLNPAAFGYPEDRGRSYEVRKSYEDMRAQRLVGAQPTHE